LSALSNGTECNMCEHWSIAKSHTVTIVQEGGETCTWSKEHSPLGVDDPDGPIAYQIEVRVGANGNTSVLNKDYDCEEVAEGESYYVFVWFHLGNERDLENDIDCAIWREHNMMWMECFEGPMDCMKLNLTLQPRPAWTEAPDGCVTGTISVQV
jgi:hypothetical protein